MGVAGRFGQDDSRNFVLDWLHGPRYFRGIQCTVLSCSVQHASELDTSNPCNLDIIQLEVFFFFFWLFMY